MDRITSCFLKVFFSNRTHEIKTYQKLSADHFSISLEEIQSLLPEDPDKISLFIPKIICNIYEFNELKYVKATLNSDFIGDKLLIYLALLYEPTFLKKNGRIHLKHAGLIIECILEKIRNENNHQTPNKINQAESRVKTFLEKIRKKDSGLIQATQAIKFDWPKENECHLIFGEADTFNDEISELAGKILFKYQSKNLPRVIKEISEDPTIRKEIKNIIVLAPEAIGLICKLGAAEKITGILKKSNRLPLPKAQELYSESAKALNYDLVSKLNPDLIVASQDQADALTSKLSKQISSSVRICIVPSTGENAALIEELGLLLKVDYWAELAAYHRLQAPTISLQRV